MGEPISDHNVVTFNANVYPYRHKHTKKEFYNFKKADWEQLNTLFEIIPWDCAFLSQDIHVVWRAWLNLFNTAVDQCIPKRTNIHIIALHGLQIKYCSLHGRRE